MIYQTTRVVNALSVDVEEYYHATIFQGGVKDRPDSHLESRVEGNVDLLLKLLSDHGVRGTFFILGELVDVHRRMVRRIAAERHEVACHGYHHQLVYRQTREEFRMDIRRAKMLLEDLTGTSVVGFRAPTFSIGHAQAWALDVLLEEGFRYDSSIYPIFHDLYGQPWAPRFPHRIRQNGHAALTEFPVGTVRLLGVNLPIGGGGYFRLLPLAFTRWGIHRVNAREKMPVMFYLHPWELDSARPRHPMSRYRRFRLHAGLETTQAKLSRLLQEVPFSTVQDILAIH